MKNVFLFSGQGSQFYQMGLELYQDHTTFQTQLNQLNQLYLDLSGLSIIDTIYDPSKHPTAIFDQTPYTHPAIFLIEYALAITLIAEGIQPDICLGSSLGEIAAATLSGYLDKETALKLIFTQAQCLEDCCDTPGGMLGIINDSELFFEEPLLYENSHLVSINTPLHFVISSDKPSIEKIKRFLTKQEIPHQQLPVSQSFHSPQMDKAVAEFKKRLEEISLNAPGKRGDLMSGMYGKQIETLTPDYLADIIRKPIKIPDAIRELEKVGNYNYIDISPSGTLATLVKYNINKQSQSKIYPILLPYGFMKPQGGELEIIEKLKPQLT